MRMWENFFKKINKPVPVFAQTTKMEKEIPNEDSNSSKPKTTFCDVAGLEEVKEEERTMIFYESPHRLKDTLKDMLKVFGNREISVNRELTKKYQEVIREDIETVINLFNEKDVKGEFVLIVDGFKGEKTLANDYSDLNEREYVEALLEDGMSKKDAIKVVCRERKLKKDVVYKQVLDL